MTAVHKKIPKLWSMGGLVSRWGFVIAVGTLPVAHAQPRMVTNYHPVADGTIVDGGAYGPFDGVPDAADWSFANTGYQGAVTRTTESPSSSMDSRVVWEYDVSSLPAWWQAAQGTLTFTLRGAPVYPMPDTVIQIYAYPADCVQALSDFNAGPAVLQGQVILAPFQEPTVFTLDVSAAVSAALASGVRKVGFRFQVDSGNAGDAGQAFFDALDSDPNTKPILAVDDSRPFEQPKAGR